MRFTPIVLIRRTVCQIHSETNARNVSNHQHSSTNDESPLRNSYKMRGWQIHSYDGLDDVQYSDKIRIPPIHTSTECLIKVDAAAVNPIDVAMLKGYGATFLNALRCIKDTIEFPIILGREFSGTVQQCGMGVGTNLKCGDRVWGVVPPHRSGAHAEYVVVDQTCLAKRPTTLNALEASAVLYGGLTAWSGLFVSGNMGELCGAITSSGGGSGKKICVLGGSGSVGSLAIQIGKAENAKVIASCSSDAMDMVCEYGADHIIDYSSSNAIKEFVQNGPYDIILDCAGLGPQYATKVPWTFSNYVTFSSPLLRNFDQFGLAIGIIQNVQNLLETNVRSILMNRQGIIKWGYFMPAPNGIEYLGKLVQSGKLKPSIQEVFDLNSVRDAYQRTIDGHLRGKIVIEMS